MKTKALIMKTMTLAMMIQYNFIEIEQQMHFTMLANDGMLSLMPQCQENVSFVHIFSKQPWFIVIIVNRKFWHYHEDKSDHHNRVCSLM